MNLVALYKTCNSQIPDDEAWKLFKQFVQDTSSHRIMYAGLLIFKQHRYTLYRTFYTYFIRTRTDEPKKVMQFLDRLDEVGSKLFKGSV